MNVSLHSRGARAGAELDKSIDQLTVFSKEADTPLTKKIKGILTPLPFDDLAKVEALGECVLLFIEEVT